MEYLLRQATYNDIDLLYQWANDKDVRKYSFSSHYITYKEHKDWYSQVLQRADTKQYIFLHNGKPIGQIRITVQKGIGEISYSICKDYRGMGYGKKLLHLIKEQVKKDFPEIQRLQGKVKQENVGSQLAFQHTGFKKSYELYEYPIDG